MPVDATVGSAQNTVKFPETLTGFDGRGYLHDSDGSKTLKTIFAVFGVLEGKNDPLNPVSNVGTRSGMASARGRNNPHRNERQVSSRTAHGIWTKSDCGRAVPVNFWQ